MKATTNPCTDCRDNFPLPSGPLDFFDTQVVADYVTRRTACTLCPADAKPCLQPAPAKPLAQNEPKAAPTLTDFAAWLAASQQNELGAMSAATGDTFGKHCDRFIELATVINAVREFQQVAALATCAKYAEDIVDTGGLMGARAEHGSKAYEVLKGARFDVMQAKRRKGDQQ